MKSFRSVGSLVAGGILVAGLTVANSGAAVAAESSPARPDISVTAQQFPDITDEQLEQGLRELKDSPLPRATAETSAGTATTYELGDGLSMTVTEAGSATSRLGGGFEADGQLFVSFNQFDQDMLISGAGFGLGAAICAIPGVGWIACTVVGAIITVGVVALSYNAKCPGNKQLIVHVNPSWSTCR